MSSANGHQLTPCGVKHLCAFKVLHILFTINGNCTHFFLAVVAYRNVHHKILMMNFIKINKHRPTLPRHVAPCALSKSVLAW
uniref:Uncharacterized protein n=1 Tax=Rhipicephalus appendiculatus TaxID=34631 RepID=A0A131Y9D0_RHIAP